MKVLLVDDDTHFRRSLAIGLETMGYTVFEAQGGMEALEFLQANQRSTDQIDSVVVDARMPVLDGFWLTDQISIMYPSLKVVILSAHSYMGELGRYTILTKPIRIPTLVDILENKNNTVTPIRP
jgi:CheY-like chemotaxis protein